MEIHLAVNAVPFLSSLAFLASLRTDPGQLLFGEETYPGELKLWGVLFRLFCLAAFLRFRVFWPVVAYIAGYFALGNTFGRGLEFLMYAVFATFLTGYSDRIFKYFAVESRRMPNTPDAALPTTPKAVFVRPSENSTTRRQIPAKTRTARSKSPAVRNRGISGTPVSVYLEERSQVSESPASAKSRRSPTTTTSPLVLPSSKSPVGGSSSKTGGVSTSALEELKLQKRREMEQRAASKGKAGASKAH